MREVRKINKDRQMIVIDRQIDRQTTGRRKEGRKEIWYISDKC